VYTCDVPVGVVSGCVHIQTPHPQVHRKYTHTDNIPPQTGMRRGRQADT